MANGEEDLREKNGGMRKPAVEKRYSHWSFSFGEEDSEMLLEKATGWKTGKKKKSRWESED